MTTVEKIFTLIDTLEPEQLNEVRQYIEQRRRTMWWIVPEARLAEIDALLQPVHEEAETMSEGEINAAIDDAIREVRREQTQSRD
jgi:hypothetical protein